MPSRLEGFTSKSNKYHEDCFIVTPHVSKPHDYVNHMFMRL
jgi:hypothetical protein